MGDRVNNALEGLELDHSSPIPLYHQAARLIEAAIEEGRLPGGSKLENELRLAQQLGISRPTMRAAIKQLVDKGLLVRRRGVGTIVATSSVKRVVALTSLYDDLSEAGREPSTQVLAFEKGPCPEEIRESFQATEDTVMLMFDRLRSVGSEPIALMHNAVPVDILDVTAEELEELGLYRLFRANGVTPHIATQQIGAANADEEEAELLDIEPGDPMLTMTRMAYDTSGRPIEYGWHRYRADSYTFDTVLMDR
jgi:GntR family transcriptional regulator